MSRLAGILLVVLTATSFADPATPPKVESKAEDAATAKSSKFPLRVVKVLLDSDQALLFDKNRGRHVLVEVGESVGDYVISAIDEDEVTVTGKDIPVEVVLAAPETPKQRRAARKAAKDAAAAAKETAHEATPVAGTDAAPSDPYGEKAPSDPYGGEPSADDGEALAPVADAPIRATPWGDAKGDGKADGSKSTTSPFANMDANAAKPTEDVANAGKPPVAKPAKTAPAPVVTTPEAEPTPAPAVDGPTKLSKKEVAAALTDFGKLSTSIDGTFGATGLTIAKVQATSVFAKAGLLAGDVVTSVNGKRLRTIDDAADLYARAGGMKSATVQIVRAGKPQTIRISIQ